MVRLSRLLLFIALLLVAGSLVLLFFSRPDVAAETLSLETQVSRSSEAGIGGENLPAVIITNETSTDEARKVLSSFLLDTGDPFSVSVSDGTPKYLVYDYDPPTGEFTILSRGLVSTLETGTLVFQEDPTITEVRFKTIEDSVTALQEQMEVMVSMSERMDLIEFAITENPERAVDLTLLKQEVANNGASIEDLRSEMVRNTNDIRNDTNAIRTDVNSNMSALRGDLDTNVRALQSYVEATVKHFEWAIGLMAAGVTAAVTGVFVPIIWPKISEKKGAKKDI